jgi:hypothetical protein
MRRTTMRTKPGSAVRHTTTISGLKVRPAGSERALTSMDVRSLAACGLACLPSLGLFRRVSFTDRFTVLISDLCFLTATGLTAHATSG